MLSRKKFSRVVAITSVAFVSWSAAFIYRTSSVAIDGKRYFVLFEDAMVSMRYAWNLSHGMGLVWNPGERVEGYTNLLMTLLMSLATVSFDKRMAVLAVQIFGVVVALACAFLVMAVIDLFGNSAGPTKRLIKFLAFVSTLACYPLVYWSLMGMETGLLTLFVLAATLAVFQYSRESKKRWLGLLPLFLGLAYLTRPDSAILAVLILAYFLWEGLKRSSTTRVFLRSLFVGCLFVAFIVGQVAFRWIYYGELVPNTYVLKISGIPLAARIANGLHFIYPFLLSISVVLFISLLGTLTEFRAEKLLIISMLLALTAYQVFVGGDPWDYWRLMAPALPLLLALFISEVVRITHSLISPDWSNSYPGWVARYISIPTWTIGVQVLFGLFILNLTFLPEISLFHKPYSTDSYTRVINTAVVLNNTTTKDATVGVFWAGIIPYYTGRYAIDFLGKSDKYIARRDPDLSGATGWGRMTYAPGHNKYDLNYSIKQLKPTYVQMFHWGTQNLDEWARDNYVLAELDGTQLFLLRDSRDVLWEKLEIIR